MVVFFAASTLFHNEIFVYLSPLKIFLPRLRLCRLAARTRHFVRVVVCRFWWCRWFRLRYVHNVCFDLFLGGIRIILVLHMLCFFLRRPDNFRRHRTCVGHTIFFYIRDFRQCNRTHTHYDSAQKTNEIQSKDQRRHKWPQAPFYTKRQVNCKYIAVYSERKNAYALRM